jgi:hypothetical protein
VHVHVDTLIHSRVCTDKRDHGPTSMYPVSDYELTLPALLLMQQVQQAQAQEERQVSRHSLFVFMLFSTCVHHLLECLGFTWCLLMVVPTLPIPQHGVCKASPGCGHENPSLVSKVICIYHAYIVEALAERVDQELPFSLSTFVHHLAQPEHLGIAWLLHSSSLSVCAEAWLFQGLA